MTAAGTNERHPYLAEGRTDVLAHRGASAAAPPGNHLGAFTAALESGVDHLETDVQASADGRIVVFHDERLDDVTTGSGRIADHSWSELESLCYVVDGRPTDRRLVLLDDVLTAFPNAFLNIDVKTDQAVDGTVELLLRHDARHRVCVAAFGWRRLRRLRRALGPDWCSAMSQPEIVVVRLATWLRLPVPRVADVVQLPRSKSGVVLVDRAMVERCHRSGIAVHVWTVNDAAEMQELRSFGVDAVITDRPDIAVTTFRSDSPNP